ncbi:cytochrome P450 [Embleya sp. NPDC008237]|uniref:cytochrome P450 n=1 Tax=Embleya sp. NPDC008237 TaxID=3363978 RepID=UPI0036EB5FAC
MTDTTQDTTIPTWPMPRSCPLLPPDRYAELREEPPRQVRLDDGTLAWLVTRYADMRAAMLNPSLSVDITLPGFPLRLPLPPDPLLHSFLRLDPPEHTRVRRMVMPEFNNTAVDGYRPAVRELVQGLLDTVAEQPQPVDLLPAFAFPIPALMIARILGVPERDLDAFQEQNLALTRCDLRNADAVDAFGALSEYLEGLVRDKEREPSDDLISRLVHLHVAKGEFGRDELVAMVLLLLVAGAETTASQIALSVLTLLRHPEQIQPMLEQPGRLGKVIDELLRYWSISQDNQVRVAKRETTLGGVPIRPGHAVVFAISAANHDDSVFTDAARFDPDRDARHHLAFGHGTHFCPGAALAKMEMEIALPALFRRFPNLRLGADLADLSFRYDTVVYGVNELPVTW